MNYIWGTGTDTGKVREGQRGLAVPDRDSARVPGPKF